MNAHILITDDDAASCQLFKQVLRVEGYHVDWEQTGDQALTRLRPEPYDLLLVDVRMPGMTGLEVSRTVHQEYPGLPVVVMTAFGSMETAIEAIGEGAFDYISKPMNLEELKTVVARALAQEQQSTTSESRDEQAVRALLDTVIGRSAAMVDVYKAVARVAPTKNTVLILGESGTGKELIAHAIHQYSPRVRRPFVAVDCGVLTETLLESELFGHVRGSFTGAVADKRGVFEEAHGGTCFLDEIGNISANMQAKLLRVLQEHEIRRVGGKEWSKVDVRVVAATNSNLSELVKQRTFRHDLYYRLNAISFHLPPLRERVEDIPALAFRFLQRYSEQNGKEVTAISDEAMERLCTYAWPGNIRELGNTIERAVAFARQSVLAAEDLPNNIRAGDTSVGAHDLSPEDHAFFAGNTTLDEVNKRYIRFVLRQTQGNISRAAKILDIDRRSLYRMLARFKVEPFYHEENDTDSS